MSEFSQTVPELVSWARKNDFSLALPVDRLAFLLAIATLNGERMDGEMSEGELIDAFQHVSKADIALHAVAANAGNAHGSTFNGGGGQKIGGGRGIALDQIVPWRLILLLTLDDKALVLLVLDLDAEAAHQMQRNIDIGFGNQLAFDRDLRIARRQRRGHQQRSQKLAGDAAVNADVAAGEAAFQAQRRI